MIIQKRLGSLKCINIIREAYFRNTIRKFINGTERVLFVGGGTGASLEDYCQTGLKITFTDIDAKELLIKAHNSEASSQNRGLMFRISPY